MNDKEFSAILLRLAVAATVCDGHCDEKEIEIVRTWAKTDFYLQNIDQEVEIESTLHEAINDIFKFLHKSLEALNLIDFSLIQKIIVINLILAVIKADNVIQDSEINFVKTIFRNLKLSEEVVETIFGTWWIISADINPG